MVINLLLEKTYSLPLEINSKLKTSEYNPKCVCEKLYGIEYMRSRGSSHEQVWHKFPQCSASGMKGLLTKCPWVVYAYGCYDLCKPRFITLNKFKAGQGENSVIRFKCKIFGQPEVGECTDGEHS
jgi:hypothetical protein